jgi:hypothetical protein
MNAVVQSKTMMSEFEEVTIQRSQIDRKGLYGVSRKVTEESTYTMGRNNNRVREHQLSLGIIQMGFFAFRDYFRYHDTACGRRLEQG